jgi:DNA-binding NtrC family response regulator
MPNLTGMELTLAAREIRPDLPVILCTGHSHIMAKENASKFGIQKYVVKPILGDELINAVSSLLGK